jgi:hypothetical protein
MTKFFLKKILFWFFFIPALPFVIPAKAGIGLLMGATRTFFEEKYNARKHYPAAIDFVASQFVIPAKAGTRHPLYNAKD